MDNLQHLSCHMPHLGNSIKHPDRTEMLMYGCLNLRAERPPPMQCGVLAGAAALGSQIDRRTPQGNLAALWHFHTALLLR